LVTEKKEVTVDVGATLLSIELAPYLKKKKKK